MTRNPLAWAVGRLMLGLIWGYRLLVSPLLGPSCRYLPTCSDYAAQAIARHGGWRGFWLALARISRCHPWGSHGFDPVPETLAAAPFYAPWRYGQWSMASDRPENDGQDLRGMQ